MTMVPPDPVQRQLAAMQRMLRHLLHEAEDLQEMVGETDPQATTLPHVIQFLCHADAALSEAAAGTDRGGPSRPSPPTTQGYRHDH
jgi:hypothetical protein